MKAIALVAALALSGCGATGPVVTIAPGLHPRLDPAGAEQLAREAVEGNVAVELGGQRAPDAVSITAIPGGSTYAGYLAGASWIVEFRGAFTVSTGIRPPTTRLATRAWVQVSDDETDTVLAVNFGD